MPVPIIALVDNAISEIIFRNNVIGEDTWLIS